MTPDSEEIWSKLRALKPALKDWNITRLRVFGSVSRGEAGPDSDVDLIADFQIKPGLFKFVDIQNHISDQVGRPVDLFTEESIWRYIRNDVLREARDVYE